MFCTVVMIWDLLLISDTDVSIFVGINYFLLLAATLS